MATFTLLKLFFSKWKSPMSQNYSLNPFDRVNFKNTVKLGQKIWYPLRAFSGDPWQAKICPPAKKAPARSVKSADFHPACFHPTDRWKDGNTCNIQMRSSCHSTDVIPIMSFIPCPAGFFGSEIIYMEPVIYLVSFRFTIWSLCCLCSLWCGMRIDSMVC